MRLNLKMDFIADSVCNRKLSAEGALELLYVMNPELIKIKGCNQDNPYHSLNLWDHLVATTNNILELENFKHFGQQTKRVLVMAALLHDVGKPDVKATKYVERYGREIDTFYGHAAVSEKIAREILVRDNSFNYNEMSMITFLIKNHDAFANFRNNKENYTPITRKNVLKLVTATTDTISTQNYNFLIDRQIALTYLAEVDIKAHALMIRDKDNNIIDTMEDKLGRIRAIRKIFKEEKQND
jgi:hypothetical protein